MKKVINFILDIVKIFIQIINLFLLDFLQIIKLIFH